MSNTKITERAKEILRSAAVIVTAADIKDGIIQQVQLYFESEGQAVMDVVNKDDLVQNWPDAGAYAFNCDGKFRKITMFEGDEDMYFRVDGGKDESDDIGLLPGVVFMESVEQISQLKL
ncbi:MAG: hypothetical protein IKA87_09460 [Lentisphaeria bacterium]|nr:hypothetical protein [Lentisphaeria bacterium]